MSMNIYNSSFLTDDFAFVLRTKMRYGVGSANLLSQYLRELSLDRVGFVVDGNLLDRSQAVRRVVDEIKKVCRSVIVEEYRESFEPTYQYLDVVKCRFKNGDTPLIDGIVAIGGGSVLDTAKGIAILCTNHGAALEYRGFPEHLNQPLPVIAIPSTAGTGSEVVYNASFIDLQSRVKMGINSSLNYPVLAILDPLMASGAPGPVVVSSGVDAFVHAFESYFSKKENYLNRLFARESLRLSYTTLPLLKKDTNNLELCGRMQLAAYLAMIALSNSSSGPAASLSYLLGTHFNVPHGVAGGALIAKVARLNHELGYYGYAELADVFGGGEYQNKDTKTKSDNVVVCVERFVSDLGIPSDLSSFGVRREHIPQFLEFCRNSLKSARELNPVALPDDVMGKFIERLITH
ncbi:MAG: iron-containing alcohol dehydrogenase [Bacteroidota bacterium]|jgi:alcohol dehydrogenase